MFEYTPFNFYNQQQMIIKVVYRLIGFLILLFTHPVYAVEVYKWQDEQGRSHYSDKKHDNAKVYQLTKSYSYYVVRKVYDGDTVLLSDGRKIRLLGINTPEIQHSDKVAQAGGDVARVWLTQQLLGAKVRLEFDQQKRDKYKRVLAHIFNENQVHINRELVRLGYASTNIFPPNLKYIMELLAVEQTAEKMHLGIWAYPEYQIKKTSEINHHNKRGWQRIVGEVTRIKETRKNRYLKMSHHFDVRIKKEHLQYFEDLKLLIGKKIEVRGWINRDKNGFTMLVKHPGAIKILN